MKLQYLTSCHICFLQIKTLDINDSKNCSDRFDANRNIGWIIFASILASYALKSREKNPQTSIEEQQQSSAGVQEGIITDQFVASQISHHQQSNSYSSINSKIIISSLEPTGSGSLNTSDIVIINASHNS